MLDFSDPMTLFYFKNSTLYSLEHTDIHTQALACCGACVWVRGQLLGDDCLFSPCECLGLKSPHQVWWQSTFTTVAGLLALTSVYRRLGRALVSFVYIRLVAVS